MVGRFEWANIFVLVGELINFILCFFLVFGFGRIWVYYCRWSYVWVLLLLGVVMCYNRCFYDEKLGSREIRLKLVLVIYFKFF